jgi:uncharacterized membrane protein YvbJ
VKKCPKCDRSYDDGWEICLKCGSRLEVVKTEADDRPQPSNPQPAKPQPSNPEMMYCNECGAEVRRKAVICPSCGMSTSATKASEKTFSNPAISDADAPDWAYLLTCCCTPIAGIILYLIWKDERPKAAKSLLPWVIASVIISVVLVLLSFLIGAVGGLLGAM